MSEDVEYEDFDHPTPRHRVWVLPCVLGVLLLLAYIGLGYYVHAQEDQARQTLWQDRVVLAPTLEKEATAWIAQHVITEQCYAKHRQKLWWHDRIGYRNMLKEAEQACLSDLLNRLAMDSSTSITQEVLRKFISKTPP